MWDRVFGFPYESLLLTLSTATGTVDADFGATVDYLTAPVLRTLERRLTAIAGLGHEERRQVHSGAGDALRLTVMSRITRVLLLELNAARVTGELTAGTAQERFAQFARSTTDPGFWASVQDRYPPLLPRLDTLMARRVAAAISFARRFAADRPALSSLLGGEAGALTGVRFEAGDAHRGGHSVVLVSCAAGPVVYKPRVVDADATLAGFLAEVLAHEPAATRIRVPRVLDRPGYAWAEHIAHRYCAGPAELRAFYRGLGHWLAVMRVLGGNDLHAENVIACGPVPVVVDCETLFTPEPPARPSGLGAATDRAAALLDSTVLRTGLLPGRGRGLGFRGVDVSAVGALPGQQPSNAVPVVLDPGTDMARLGTITEPVVAAAANHPSPQPALADYWGEVLAGFDALTAHLSTLDNEGRLEPLLARFAHCPVRVVARGTETYAELARMLWHPTSLHNEAAAIERAADVLTRMARYSPLAPDRPDVVAAEIVDLCHGDIPYFHTTPSTGALVGPGGTTWPLLPESDPMTGALAGWRGADLEIERRAIRSALVCAYLNDGWMPTGNRMRPSPVDTDELDRRRRTQVRDIMVELRDHAVRGDDGTATWIALTLDPTGWAVKPLGGDLYAGGTGVAVLLAGYQHEVAAGRADPVDGLDHLLDGVLATMRAEQDWTAAQRRDGLVLRPHPPGAYLGLGSRIWAWLTLSQLGAGGPDALDRACGQADLIPEALPHDEDGDLLGGAAGAIVPLLQLAARTGEARFIDIAIDAGQCLVERARRVDGTACWPAPRWPDGLGGFAHGATGVGWALHHLARVSGAERFATLGDEALRYQDSLYDSATADWLDLRQLDVPACAWCHGAVGIGLAVADLRRHGHAGVGVDPDRGDMLERAVRSSQRSAFGWSHVACHGDLGAWELLAVVEPGRSTVDAMVLSSMEQYGIRAGQQHHTFIPGLLPGIGGVAYQLLRMHPDSHLPSVLTLGGDPW